MYEEKCLFIEFRDENSLLNKKTAFMQLKLKVQYPYLSERYSALSVFCCLDREVVQNLREVART